MTTPETTKTHSRIRRSAARLFCYLAAILGGVYIVMFFGQGRAVFESTHNITRTPSVFKWTFEELSLPVGKETTRAWFIPAEHERGVVLSCHGNGGNMGTHLNSMRVFHELGFSVLMFDYGGFGNSTGTPSERRCYADAQAMWDYLTKTRGVSAERIVIHGTSFGGGTACELASHTRPGALILQSTYLSMAKAAYGRWAPVAGLFLRHRFNNEKKISSVHAPVLVVHSREDTLYPFSHGRRLFELANEPKQFIELHGDHGSWDKQSGDMYRIGLDTFLDPLFPPDKLQSLVQDQTADTLPAS